MIFPMILPFGHLLAGVKKYINDHAGPAVVHEWPMVKVKNGNVDVVHYDSK